MNGHPFSAENTVRSHDRKGRESRACRTCARNRQRDKAQREGRTYVPQAERVRRGQVRQEKERQAVAERKAQRDQYCQRGHARTPENTRYDARVGEDRSPQRTCRVCERERAQARAARLREAQGVATPDVTT